MAKFTFATEEGGFDNHITHSIRGYRELNKDIINFSEHFIEEDSSVLDIGCSTGRLIREMKVKNEKRVNNCKYYGIEMESNFEDSWIDKENLNFLKMDIREFDWKKGINNCCLVTSIFTLQFIPKKDRLDIIKNIYSKLNKGGAFIFSEKINSPDAQIEEMITFCYYDWKNQYFSSEEILEKERTLRSMMKLMTLDEIMSMLTEAGFKKTQVFWQNFNFIGIIAIKD